jgi:hypothetical protein
MWSDTRGAAPKAIGPQSDTLLPRSPASITLPPSQLRRVNPSCFIEFEVMALLSGGFGRMQFIIGEPAAMDLTVGAEGQYHPGNVPGRQIGGIGDHQLRA